MSYATVLKSLRKKNKMTQVVAAKVIDVTSAYLSKIENGTKIPSMMLLKKMSIAYKVPLSIINYLASKEEISKLKKSKEFHALQQLIDEMIQYLFFEDDYNLKKFASDFKNVRKLKAELRAVESSKSKKYNKVISKPAKASESTPKYGKRKTK